MSCQYFDVCCLFRIETSVIYLLGYINYVIQFNVYMKKCGSFWIGSKENVKCCVFFCFLMQCALWEKNNNGRTLKLSYGPCICTSSCCLIGKPYMPVGVFVLINSFVDGYHILQNKFGKIDSCHYILNEHCLQPDCRVANTCSAWLKGAVSVDSWL